MIPGAWFARPEVTLAATGQRPELMSASIAATAPAPAVARRRHLAPPIAANSAPRSFYARYGKRALDLTLGTLMFVSLLPLISLIAVAVLITSGWPIFYASERVGRGGQPFRMWKFRTMVRDADAVFERWKATHPALAQQLLTSWKLQDDPRVTALGRFLRKSSLDELPQFWNVLNGTMTLVGPRPYLSRESLDPALEEAIVSVKPGLTGPFQVCGRKGLTPLARQAMEAGYAEDVSFARDAGYLLWTLRPLLRMDGD
ncbi:MAG TPA: sugar transferase [Dehalococcoidia bacterium]|nr:sugar transferase [Dehalococcoidia bacterium]